jgi:hypothetical protein
MAVSLWPSRIHLLVPWLVVVVVVVEVVLWMLLITLPDGSRGSMQVPMLRSRSLALQEHVSSKPQLGRRVRRKGDFLVV